jgi:hypothetical protein
MKLLHTFTFRREVADFSEASVSSNQIINYNILEDTSVRTVILMYGARKIRANLKETAHMHEINMTERSVEQNP